MSQVPERPERLLANIVSGRMSRRRVLQRSLALGLSAPAISLLLAACGDDDDEPAATSTTAPSAPEATATSAPDTSEPDSTSTPESEATAEPDATATEPAGTEPTAPPSSGVDPEAKYGGTLRFGALRYSNATDPNQNGGISHSWLQGNVYDKLVDFDNDGGLVGALAESWEVVDDRTYVFTLRQGVKFHRGQDFTAQDVVATFERVLNPDIAAMDIATVSSIASTETPDDFTVEVTLGEVDISFLSVLAGNGLYIVSAEDAGAAIEDPSDFNGTGPFYLDNWEPQRHYILKKNENYWREGLPYLDEVIITPILDDGARVNALLSGEVDIGEYIPWQSFAGLEAAGFTLHTSFGLQSFIRLNHNEPPLDDKRFRQALAYVLDNEAINSLAFGGFGKVISGPLQPPGTEYYFEELEGTYTKDWDKARELLAEAGYADPADVPPLDMQVSTSALAQQPGLVVQEQLESFGFKVEWTTVDTATLAKNRAEGTYVLHIDGGGMAWPDPDYLRSHFHSEMGITHALAVNYKNERLDALLEEGARTTDVERRKEIYLEAEKIILDELPWIFILWRPQTEATAPYVRGYTVLPNGLQSYHVDRFENLWLDK